MCKGKCRVASYGEPNPIVAATKQGEEDILILIFWQISQLRVKSVIIFRSLQGVDGIGPVGISSMHYHQLQERKQGLTKFVIFS